MFGKSVLTKLSFSLVLFFAGVLLFVTAPAIATAAETKQNKAKSQMGIITIPETAVYLSADFDADVIDYLQENQKVPMSNKKFESNSGMGAFYRVKTPKGKIGFVSDTDIMSLKKKKKLSEEEHEGDLESLYFKRMVGASLAQVNYTEKFQGKASSAQTTMFGFRATGPDILGDSPPLDLNILVGFKPPSYYDTMSDGRASGFFLLGDVTFLFPLIDWDKALLNFGIGGMWSYTHFKVPVGVQTYSADDLRIGLDLSFGGAARFGSFVARADVKYYIEKTQYSGLMISLQKIY